MASKVGSQRATPAGVAKIQAAIKSLNIEVPIGELPARNTTVNINDDIHVDMRLDRRQSDALRALFAGLKSTMKYPLHRPMMGLVWFLEELAAQMEGKDDV